jgi:hypothetical protein
MMLLFWDANPGSSAPAFEYQAEGYLHCLPVNAPNAASNAYDRLFSVQVRDNSWQLVVEDLRPTNQRSREIVGSTNNTEMFGLQVTAGGQESATVESNRIPWDVELYARFVWLGLCSHAFLQDAPDLPPPMMNVHAGENERKFRASWVRFEKPPHLPGSAVYLNPGFILTPGAREGDEVMRAGGAYASGYTNGAYQVLSSTNLGGLRLPTYWKWEQFAPSPAAGNPAALTVTERIECRVTSIKLGCSLTNFLPPARDALVVDYRLAKAKPSRPMVSYVVRDGRWISAEEVRRVPEKRPFVMPKTRRHPWVILLLTLAAILPTVVLGFLRFRKRLA